MALMKRSPKMTANWALAMDHSRGGIFPLFLGAVQDQIEQFGSGLVAGEVPPDSDGAPELGVQRLDRIRNRYDAGGAF